MKNNLIYRLFICSSLFFAGCSGSEETDNAQLEADISPVIPKVSGSVIRVNVQDNQLVKEGDTLVLLDDANYKIAAAQAEIALEQAKQSVNISKGNSKTAEVSVSAVNANSNAVFASISSAKAGVEAAKTRLWLAVKNYERFEKLLQQKSAGQQQFDGVKAEKEAAEAQLRIAESQASALSGQADAAKLQVAAGESQFVTSKTGIGLSELSVKQAEQALASARLLLSYCTITAPADGVISRKNVQKGQVVSVGQPLMAVADNRRVWIVANFKETQLEKMRVNQPAEINVDAYSDKTFKGKIESFAQATGAKFSLLPPDNATGNFVKVTQRVPVKIVFTEPSNADYPLRAGMSVSVKVKIN